MNINMFIIMIMDMDMDTDTDTDYDFKCWMGSKNEKDRGVYLRISPPMSLPCLSPLSLLKSCKKNTAAPALLRPDHQHKFSLMGWLNSFFVVIYISHLSIKENSPVFTNISLNLPTGLYFHHRAEWRRALPPIG